MEELTHEGDPSEPATLHAVFASPGAPDRRATVLFLHGKGGRGAEWRGDAARALRLGYNVLVPDLRGHPPSTGERITYGLLEKLDLRLLFSAVAARHRIDPGRIGIDGCSMGSIVALQYAAEDPVSALWLQSPFGTLEAMAVQYAHRATGLPPWLLSLPTRLALRGIERDGHLELKAIDPIAAASRIDCPAVVVHGEADTLVPVAFSNGVYEALAGEKELWRVPRCGHCHHPDEPQAIRSREYVRRWAGFFTLNLPPGGSGARRTPARRRARRA